MKHTGGEWDRWGSTIIYSPGHGVICELSEIHPESGLIEHDRVSIGSPNWDEAVANSHLLVAASLMLAALEASREFMRQYFSFIDYDDLNDAMGLGLDNVMTETNAAIAKAKGEEA